MVVARRAETYIRRRVQLVSSISRRVNARAREGRSETGSGTSRRSRWRRAGQRTRIYETVIFRKLRAGNSWPCRRFMAAVCPACAINPSLSPRIELPPILCDPLLPPAAPRASSPLVHIASCTYARERSILFVALIAPCARARAHLFPHFPFPVASSSIIGRFAVG